MDYKKIHDNIIDRAKHRNLSGYSENHHIVPRCLGGTNTKENLVRLTAKEHFLVHLLLIEIYPNEDRLKVAIFRMLQKSSNQERQVKSGKQFERLRHMAATAHGNLLRGKKRKGFTETHKQNISKGKTGKPSHRKGVKLSDLTKAKIGNASIGRINGEKNPMKRPEVAQKFKGDNNPMKRPEVAQKFKGDKNGNAKVVKVLSTNKVYTTINDCIIELKISRTQFRRLVQKGKIVYEKNNTDI